MPLPQTKVGMSAIPINHIDNRLVVQGHESRVAQFQARLAPRRGRHSWSRLAQSLEERVQVQLNGSNRLLHQEQHRVHKGKVALARESLLVSTVLMTKQLLSKESASIADSLTKPKQGMCILHPIVNAAFYLHCTANYFSMSYKLT